MRAVLAEVRRRLLEVAAPADNRYSGYTARDLDKFFHKAFPDLPKFKYTVNGAFYARITEGQYTELSHWLSRGYSAWKTWKPFTPSEDTSYLRFLANIWAPGDVPWPDKTQVFLYTLKKDGSTVYMIGGEQGTKYLLHRADVLLNFC